MVAFGSFNGLVSRLSLLCLVPVVAYFQLPFCHNDESLSISSLRKPQAVSHKPYSIVECLGQSWICASLWLAFPLGGGYCPCLFGSLGIGSVGRKFLRTS